MDEPYSDFESVGMILVAESICFGTRKYSKHVSTYFVSDQKAVAFSWYGTRTCETFSLKILFTLFITHHGKQKKGKTCLSVHCKLPGIDSTECLYTYTSTINFTFSNFSKDLCSCPKVLYTKLEAGLRSLFRTSRENVDI